MDKKELLKVIKQIKADSKKRNFNQSVDIIVNLKDLNLKNPDDQVEFYISIQSGLGTKRSVCALVGPELKEEAGKVCDTVIEQLEFKKCDKKKVKNLANKHDYFIAQANIMPQVATTFGRILGPKGKMPNPKAGCVVPPKGSGLKPLYDRLQNTLKISAKKAPVVQVIVGKENLTDEALADNAWQVYDQIVHHLPKDKNNVKNVYLKLTMGKPVKVA